MGKINKKITVVLDEETYSALVEHADDLSMSVSEFVRVLIVIDLKEKQK